ncbi:hypothetical protein [Nisaea denitrificans]|uniref:hypothetical protein n=1 Tax=Nisaea denitrificans TaxID=390877 RepID=UPI000490545C|nr:hypothetical protein [Nisaea denitrificans]
MRVDRMMRVFWLGADGQRSDITRSQIGAKVLRAAKECLKTSNDPEHLADLILPNPETGEVGAIAGLRFADSINVSRNWTKIEIEEMDDPSGWALVS